MIRNPISMLLNEGFALLLSCFLSRVVKPGLKGVFLILLLFSATGSLQTASAQQKYSKVKIYISKDHVRNLQQAGLAFDHGYYDEENQYFITSVNPNDLSILQNSHIKYTVLIDDEAQDFLKRNKVSDFYLNDNTRTVAGAGARMSFFESPAQSIANIITTPAAFTMGSMGGYYTLAEINTKINNMVANYPTMVKVDTIGTTLLGNKIRVVKIASNVTVTKAQPEILIDALHHAREPLSMMNVIFFMQYILENYSTNARIKEIVDSRQLYFIPCINPDGYDYNHSTNPSGGGLNRKNRKNNGDGTFGVDLNRNYGFDYGYNNVGSSNVTSADNYRGVSAFSELETQAMRNYVRTRKFKIMLEYHAYGGDWINSYCVPARTLNASDALFLSQSGAQMTKYNFYKVGTPLNTVGYEANGGSNDWWFAGDVANIDSIPSFSPEVGLGLTTFWPAASTIIPYCKEVFYGTLQAVLIGGSFVKVEDKTPLNLPAGSTGNFTFTVRRLGRVDSSVTVTVLPIEGIQSVGAPVTISSLPKYGNTYDGSIGYTLTSGIPTGSRVRFAYQTVTGGITKLDTVTTFYTPAAVFSDDMETAANFATKWTAATWAYSTKKSVSGTHSLANVPATGTASYANNVNINITTKTAMDLGSATAAYLSFWVYYKSENGSDKMQVLGSSAATSNAYVALSGINTVAENAGNIGGVPSLTGQQGYWVREIMNLAPHIGQNNFNLRFNFTSGASTVDSGFFVDDIMIIKTSTALLPVQFSSFTGKLLDNMAILEWDATLDAQFDHFEIERSADGLGFTKIGNVDAGQPFKFYDAQTAQGNNYYRIRQLSKDGMAAYSKTIVLNVPVTHTLTLAPTFSNSIINLGLHTGKNENVYVEIIDPMGRMIKQLNYNISNGNNSLSLNISNLSAQRYFVKVVNSNNEVLGVKSFIKY